MNNTSVIQAAQGVTPQALTEHLEALIALIEDAHDTHIYAEDDEHPADCVYCAAVAGARTALASPSDNRPGIHIGCWYGESAFEVPLPAAFIGLPPMQDGGEPVEAILKVHNNYLDTIEPGDEALHEFVLKWERYALEHDLPFDASEDFEYVDNRWQVVIED
jgi:hypothetical protein